MKLKGYIILLLNLLLSSLCLGQKITLNDLLTLSKKQNWEEVNSILLNKGWTYFSSTKGDEEHYNTIIWSFEKERYNDKAIGWFRLYTYEGIPGKIIYTIHNKPAYTLIKNSLSSSGFKLINNEIEDDVITATYQNKDFEITCSTMKMENDYSATTTGYQFLVINRSGMYDPDNGYKKIYDKNGFLEQEVNLKNGLLNGSFKEYHSNGKLKMEGYFIDGKENGYFKEYYEDGTLQYEYNAVNGDVDGEFRQYTNKQLTAILNFKQGKKNGNCYILKYDEDGILSFKFTEAYLNDIKNGRWSVVRYIEGKEKEITYENYLYGKKDGICKEYLSPDSLQTAEYKDGLLDGLCTLQVLMPLSSIDDGETINFMPIASISTYSGGILNGKCTYFSMGKKATEGYYVDGERDGEWKDYITMGNYLGAIEYVVNYENGKREGLAQQYFYSCLQPSADDLMKISYTQVNLKVNGQMEYHGDLKHGTYLLLDSLGRILENGNYLNDQKDGKWLEVETYDSETTEVTYLKGEYIKGKKIGTWTAYGQNENIQGVYNYNNDKLSGETVIFNSEGLASQKLLFKDDQLLEVTYYDSLGLQPQIKFELFDIKESQFRCRLILYHEKSYEIQEYWLRLDKDDTYNPFDFVTYFTYNLETKNGYISSHKEGAYGIYDLDNKPLVLGKYYKELRIGKWEYFYYSQNIKIEENRSGPEEYFELNGKRFSGEFIYLNEETGNKEIRKIKNGFRNGKTKYISVGNDNVIKTEKYKDGILSE